MKEIRIRIPDFTWKSVGLGALFVTATLAAIGGLSWFASTDERHKYETTEAGQQVAPDHVQLNEVARQNIEIQTTMAQVRTLTEWLQSPGVVKPDERRVIRIRPLARGIVRSVRVRSGDYVRKDQALFEFDNMELTENLYAYRSLQAEQRGAIVQRELARKSYQRAERLLAAEAIPAKEVEIREAALKQAEAALQGLDSSLQDLEQKLNRFGLSKKELSVAAKEGTSTVPLNMVHSPQSGVVVEINVAPGESVDPEQVVIIIAELSSVWVMANVYEKDLGRVALGKEAESYFSAYPDVRFRGLVTNISSVLDEKTRTAKVRCEVSNPRGHLKLEMFGTVLVPTRGVFEALAVPDSALQRIQDQEAVFVIKGQDVFEKRFVRVGRQRGGMVEILENLQPGEKVVTHGSFYLKSVLLRDALGGGHAH